MKSVKCVPWTSSEIRLWWTNHSKLLDQLPDYKLNYTSNRPNQFRNLGSLLVNHLIELGPISSKMFSDIMHPCHQKQLLSILHKAMSEKNKRAGTGLGPKGKSGYYLSQKNFSYLIPEAYKKSDKAPRITSVTPNSLHGMKKDFQVLNLRTFSALYPQYFILEVDLAACHSRIASSLLAKDDNPLEQSLNNDNFWETEVNKYLPWFQEVNPAADFKTIKSIFKVFLYTSLNGGNPSGELRVEHVLNQKAQHLCVEPYKEAMHKVTARVADDWPLTSAVRDINKTCYYQSQSNPEKVLVYCLDIVEPYVLDRNKSYCAISRLLQSYEVVLLSILTGFCVEQDLMVLTLDHDGLYVLGTRRPQDSPTRQATCEDTFNLKEVLLEYEEMLTKKMVPWSTYLLRQPMPVTVKRIICNGDQFEV